MKEIININLYNNIKYILNKNKKKTINLFL